MLRSGLQMIKNSSQLIGEQSIHSENLNNFWIRQVKVQNEFKS